MPIEYELRDGALLWIKNPFTGVISYIVDLRDKSFAFTLGARSFAPAPPTHSDEERMARATAICPFCPGNESKAPAELIRVPPAEVPDWPGDPASPWTIRVFNNLFPRIPAELTGGRNESYVVIEDSRHFQPGARVPSELLFTGAISEKHFVRLMEVNAQVIEHSLRNPAVESVVVRKNQGPESGASQPHIHQQIIGSPINLPAVDVELRLSRSEPRLWDELIAVMNKLGLMIDSGPGVVSYASPIGVFPRSYDLVVPHHFGFLHQLDRATLAAFASAMHRILRFIGPIPLDYEIHQAEGLPLHAHINVRRFPYSNVAGTLNLPQGIFESVGALRRTLNHG
jgi:galactose-1-phosphate uridylyltransferase